MSRPKERLGRSNFWDLLAGNGLPLGRQRRSIAIIVLLGGILTFFLPLVSADPAVSQTTNWSLFNIVRQMYLGRLPQPNCETCGEPIVRLLLALPFDVTVVYGLMLFALAVLCFRKIAATPAWIGIVGVIFSLDTYMLRGGTNFGTKWEFEKILYGKSQSLAPSSDGPVHYGWLTVALLLVMCALVLVAVREDIDDPRSTIDGRSDWRQRE